MAKIDLKTLLDNYTNNLCGKIFKYSVLNRTKKTNDTIIIRFYNENLCHLLGLQHVYDNSTNGHWNNYRKEYYDNYLFCYF